MAVSALIAATCGAGLSVANAASAETVGQRIRVCLDSGDYTHISLSGKNAAGESASVKSDWSAGCHEFPDQRWTGDVTILLTDSSTLPISQSKCTLPATPSEGYFDCQAYLPPALALGNPPADVHSVSTGGKCYPVQADHPTNTGVRKGPSVGYEAMTYYHDTACTDSAEATPRSYHLYTPPFYATGADTFVVDLSTAAQHTPER
jgi:hypothetical protein